MIVNWTPNRCSSGYHIFGEDCDFLDPSKIGSGDYPPSPGGSFSVTSLGCNGTGGWTQNNETNTGNPTPTNNTTDPNPNGGTNSTNNPISSPTTCTGNCFDNSEEEEAAAEEEQCNTYNDSVNANNSINPSISALSNLELQDVIESPFSNNVDKIQGIGEYFNRINNSFSPLKETLAEVSNNPILSEVDLQIIAAKAKETYDILKPYENNLNFILNLDQLEQILTPQELEIVETNFLITSFFPSLKSLHDDFWPQNAEEWNEFGDFLITVIQELIPELIPGVAEVIAIKDAFNNFNNGEYISASTDLSLALIGVFTVGKLLKATAKFAKGLRVVVRLSKSFKNAKKMVKAVSNGDLTEAYSLWSKIGCKSTTSYKRVRELNNTTERQAKSFYELLTKKGKDITPNNSPPGLIVKEMPYKSVITFRVNSSSNPDTLATIDFNGGNYNSNRIKELKFN